jgi:hypothetical protein
MRYYECGICEHLHPWDWHGDCRDDANRFTDEVLRDGDEVASMEERLEADAKGE